MKEKRVVIYNGKRYTKYGNSKYYWHHGKWKEPPVSLHVQMWKDNYGEIPKGSIIHHKDGDANNNIIDNLECITEKEHKARHYADAKWAEKTKKALSEAYSNRPMIKYTCKNCGKSFESRRTYKVNFCSELCGQRWRAKNAPSTKIYEKECPKCGQIFKTTKWHRRLCYECYRERTDAVHTGEK